MQEVFGFNYQIPFHIFIYSPPIVRETQHWHSFYEIGYCYEGNGTFFVGDQCMNIGPGDLVLFPPHIPHIAESTSGSECKFFFLYFSAELLSEEDRSLLLIFRQAVLHKEDNIMRTFQELPSLYHFFNHMRSEYDSRQLGYASLLRSRIIELCVRLLRLEQSMHSDKVWSSIWMAYNQIKPSLDYIAEHYAEPIELKELAEVMLLSESRARHLFKLTIGRSFKQYLAFVRIQQAKRLLSESDLSVTEVYLSCGYQSSAPFYRAFQQLVGVSPLDYRRSQIDQNSRF